jgi:F0F1-type ATP synthase membrane subunit b/b'
MSLETVIYILLGAVVVQLFEIGYLIYLYHKKSQELDLHEKDSSKAFTKIIDNANKKAEEIVQNAVDKSEAIVYEAEAFKTKIEKEMHFVFQDIVEKRKKMFDSMVVDIAKEFKAGLDQVKETFEKNSKATSTEITAYAAKELEAFQTQTASKSASMEAYVKNRIDEELNAAKAQIEAYKQQQIIEIQSHIKENVEYITRNVLRLSIPADKQEKLILDALEKAKADNVFSV